MSAASGGTPPSVPGVLYRRRVLVVHNGTGSENAGGRATAALIEALKDRDIDVIDAPSESEAEAQISMHSLLQAVLVDWDLAGAEGHKAARRVIDAVRERSARLPIFLLAASGSLGEISAEVLSEVNDYVWLFEDTKDFLGGRILAAIDRYRATLLPPMFKALAIFAGQDQVLMAHARACWRDRFHETPNRSRVRGVLRRRVVPLGSVDFGWRGRFLARSLGTHW